MDSLKFIPVAERISIELTIWGTVASAVLILLLLIGVSLVGRMVRSTATAATPIAGSYQEVVTRWDLMRVPADQGLMLTALTGAGVVLSLLFWAALPATTPHPHEDFKSSNVKAQPPLKPLDALNKSENMIVQISAQLDELEKKKADEDAGKSKGKGKGKAAKEAAPPASKKP